jgi:heptose I phosphotransferase
VQFELEETIQPFFSAFEELMALSGQHYHAQKGRLTQRILLGQRYYFIKQHKGVGWKEILKNLLQLRLPVLSAKNEWRALTELAQYGIAVPKVMGYGKKGLNPGKLHSFILMEEVEPAISLEDLVKNWLYHPPTLAFKHWLIAKVARITRILHENHWVHRDLYICHFLLTETNRLFLIDLHRALYRPLHVARWQIKDLAGLYFSSKNSGLTKRDYLRFMAIYSNLPLRKLIKTQKKFWQKVILRGEKLYRDHL